MTKINLLKQLRTLAIAEGISYLLFGFTMPLKYLQQIDAPNYYVGMIHGVLFVLFCAWTLLVAKQYKWSLRVTLLCLASSLVPIGTFILDYKLLRNMTPAEQKD